MGDVACVPGPVVPSGRRSVRSWPSGAEKKTVGDVACVPGPVVPKVYVPRQVNA